MGSSFVVTAKGVLAESPSRMFCKRYTTGSALFTGGISLIDVVMVEGSVAAEVLSTCAGFDTSCSVLMSTVGLLFFTGAGEGVLKQKSAAKWVPPFLKDFSNG